MIKIICGEKGTGKTKMILDQANDSAQNAKGNTSFIDKDNSHMLMLTHKIRLIDASEYRITSDGALTAFIKGMLATDKDLTEIYIDGIARITRLEVNGMEKLFSELDLISKEFEMDFVITVSAACKDLPPFISKFVA